MGVVTDLRNTYVRIVRREEKRERLALRLKQIFVCNLVSECHSHSQISGSVCLYLYKYAFAAKMAGLNVL